MKFLIWSSLSMLSCHGGKAVQGFFDNNNNTFYSPGTHADTDKVKKINNFSVSTQLSLELK